MQRELAAKAREADVAVQRLHQMQAELQLARTEAHETREVSELRLTLALALTLTLTLTLTLPSP